MRSSGIRDEAMFRVGAAVLGLFAGFIVGFLLFTPFVLGGVLEKPLISLLGASAVAGAVCGVVLPSAAVTAFEGVFHFFAGVLAAIGGGEVPSSEDAPRWLRAALWVGFLYFLVVLLSMGVYSLLDRPSE